MINNDTNSDLVISVASLKSNSPSFSGSFSSENSSTTLSVSSNSTLVPFPRTSANSSSKSLKKKVSDLRCSEIRWFYRKETDSKWISFTGFFNLFMKQYILFFRV